MTEPTTLKLADLTAEELRNMLAAELTGDQPNPAPRVGEMTRKVS